MKTKKIESVTRELYKKKHKQQNDGEKKPTEWDETREIPIYEQTVRCAFFRWVCATIGACLACLTPIKYLPSPNVYFILIEFFLLDENEVKQKPFLVCRHRLGKVRAKVEAEYNENNNNNR